MIQIYKPNQKNTGGACSFNYNTGSLYVNLIKQVSWDAENKTGSFKENAKSTEGSKTIKLTDVEAAGFIRAIEDPSAKFSTVHTTPTSKTQITFNPYSLQEGVISGYGLKVVDSNTKNEFKCSFTLNEATYVREYLKFGLFNKFLNASLVKPVAKESK